MAINPSGRAFISLSSSVSLMCLTQWAESNAERFLAPLGDRWSHVRNVAEQARRVAEVVPEDDRDLLVAAAYLHDVGYASDLAVTGFHPLDGARWIRDHGYDGRLARLVAHHSCAVHEARVRGILEVLLDEFEPEESATYDALVYCDMTTGPTGRTVSFDERIEDIYRRYGPDHEVTRALDSSRPYLAACHDRTVARLAAVHALADVRRDAPLKVVLDTELYRWMDLVFSEVLRADESDFRGLITCRYRAAECSCCKAN